MIIDKMDCVYMVTPVHANMGVESQGGPRGCPAKFLNDLSYSFTRKFPSNHKNFPITFLVFYT